MTTAKFAKLFETELGQILVKVDEGSRGPEVRFFFSPEGFGVCSTALEFVDDDEGEARDKVDKAFERVDQALAVRFVQGVLEQLDLSPAASQASH